MMVPNTLKQSLVMAAFLVVSGTSLAMEPIPGEDRFAQSAGSDSSSFMAGATFGAIGDELYMQISPRFEFSAAPSRPARAWVCSQSARRPDRLPC